MKDEIQSFVELINYYGRFFENLSTLMYRLNNLLKISVEFKWTKECEQSFQAVKKCENCLVHYSPELPLLLAIRMHLRMELERSRAMYSTVRNKNIRKLTRKLML